MNLFKHILIYLLMSKTFNTIFIFLKLKIHQIHKQIMKSQEITVSIVDSEASDETISTGNNEEDQ